VEIEEIPNNLRQSLINIYANQDENDHKSGYFILRNIQGPNKLPSGNAIFYDIYLLTDSIASEEEY
jgi:hypothetical protein